MKKILSMTLAALIIFSLAACAKSTDTAETTAETTAAVDKAAASATVAADGTAASDAAENNADAAAVTGAEAINAAFAGLDMTKPETLGTVKKLGAYTGLEIETTKAHTTTDSEVDEYLDTYVLPSFTEEVDGPIQNGDVANIDYEGKKDGVAFEGGTAKGYDLTIGSGSFIEGFESGLVGKKKGETVDLNLTFPEGYQAADLAGKAVVFTVTVNSIRRQKKLTDELAAQIDPENPTVAQLKKAVKETLQKSQDMTARDELYYNAASQIIADSEVEPDEKALTYTLNTYLNNFAQQCMMYYGIDAGTYITAVGGNFEDVVAEYEPIARDAVAQRLVLQEIAKKEGLKVTDKDMEDFADSYGYTKDQFINTVGEEEAHQLVLEDKAAEFIVSHSNVTYKDGQ